MQIPAITSGIAGISGISTMLQAYREKSPLRRGVETGVRRAPAVKLGEERLEPVGMLVVDGDGLHGDPGMGR